MRADPSEAEITIGGVPLIYSQAMTLRVGITGFMMWVTQADTRATLGELADNYLARAREIEQLIHDSIKAQRAK